MRKNNTLSNLPIAAILMLVASLPCLAQVTASESTSTLAVADSGATLSMNKAMRAVPPTLEEIPLTSKTVVDSKRVKSLSPNLFKVANQVSTDTKFVSGPQLANDLDAPDFKQQFSVDDDTPIQRSRVTFVPSRGFRLPN